MTPSDKSESASRSKQDAESTSVITQAQTEGGDTASASDQQAEGSTSGPGVGQESGSGNGTEFDGTEAPPPWQRASATPQTPGMVAADPPRSAFAADSETTQQMPRPMYQPGQVPTEETAVPADPESSRAGRTTVSFAGSGSGRSGLGSGVRRPTRGPRRASLQVKRVDPWSVLKLALVLSVALFFVWMIAVAVLYGVLDGMGVWDQLNGTFNELTQPDDAASEPLISAGRVFGVASIVGAINIVLITALATVAAFIYNVAADFAGGVEVTLSERE